MTSTSRARSACSGQTCQHRKPPPVAIVKTAETVVHATAIVAIVVLVAIVVAVTTAVDATVIAAIVVTVVLAATAPTAIVRRQHLQQHRLELCRSKISSKSRSLVRWATSDHSPSHSTKTTLVAVHRAVVVAADSQVQHHQCERAA